MARPCRSNHLALLALVGGMALGLAAAPASASTAQLVGLSTAPCKFEDCGPPTPPETALVYLGEGEANRVSLNADAQQVRISDPAAQIAAGPGCSRVDEHNVSCSVPGVFVYVATRGGSDRVRSELGSQTRLTVDGGAGNDALVGGAGPDALLGGRGADRLRGRGGDDRLFDASSTGPLLADSPSPSEGGSDVFFGMPLPSGGAAPLPPGRGRDSFDGGSGTDTLSYQGRSANFRIDLASRAPVSGARRERDSIRRVENAIGGRGDDRIAGDRRANVLKGDGEVPNADPPGGDDRIAGRAGADSIEGGQGRNVLSGGPGNDTITLGASGRGERVFCGAGTDSVASPLFNDLLQDDCEKPELVGLIDGVLDPPLLRSRLPLRAGRPPIVLSGTLSCFLEDNTCQARVELWAQGPGTRRGSSPPQGTLLGSEALDIGVRENKSFELRLSRAGLRRLRRHRALRVRVVVATAGPSPQLPGYLTLLRAP